MRLPSLACLFILWIWGKIQSIIQADKSKEYPMTPEELAARHPRLYHVTEPGAWESIRKNGLLSASRLLDLYEVQGEKRETLETKRRPAAVVLHHPHHGQIILNDNVPLSEQALSKCLDDQLTPSEWLRMLNARVFFWTTEESLNRLLSARLNRTRQREVIVVDTLSLTNAYAGQMDLCPINSGATLRKPVRRGLGTFTPLLRYPFHEWSHLRGQRDEIREITVSGQVNDIEQHVMDVFLHP